MIEYKKLIKEVQEAFKKWPQPSNIYLNTGDGKSYKENEEIQSYFEHLTPETMNYEEASMMIHDFCLISDEAYCYFLPRLAKAVFEEGSNETFFYKRLKEIDPTILNNKQLKLINQSIKLAEKLQLDKINIEESKFDNAWKDWRQKIQGIDDQLARELFLAIERNDLSQIKELLNFQIDIKLLKDLNNNTPLDIAQMKGHTQIEDFLRNKFY